MVSAMIPLYKPHIPEYLPDLSHILHSGSLAYGKYGIEFEQKLKSFLDVQQLITVNSFNSAVLVVLLTLGIKPNDEIIASPMACLASTQPLLLLGAKVVWADIDPTTGTLAPDDVRKKITKKTKVIFHNHFCGYSGYIDEINAIGKEYAIPVVDDGIEAFGTKYKDNYIGNTGTDITIFSFQAVRLPTAIDGGAIVFKDKTLFEKSLLVRDSGINRKYFRDELGEISVSYDIETIGFAATMSEINSYIGSVQMNKIEALLEKQENNAEQWKQKLKEEFPAVQFVGGKYINNPNYWVFGILARNKEEYMKKFRDMGFYTSSVHFPNSLYSVFGKKVDLPGVNEFYSRFLALPCGWWVEEVV
jgi:dTDP-4-amino-4,6-dideoxygalactose transaminase